MPTLPAAALLTESVHEAFNYFSGAPIDYARIQQRSTDTVTYAGDTNNARSDTSYVSPVVDQCQKITLCSLPTAIPLVTVKATLKFHLG